MNRSEQKRITKEAMVLRYMRHTRKLSLNQAGRLVGISGSAIAHIEQGRMDISRARLVTLLEAYQFTHEEYLEYFDGRDVPLSPRDECIGIIRQLDESRLQAVHAMLVNLMPPGTTRHSACPTQREQKHLIAGVFCPGRGDSKRPNQQDRFPVSMAGPGPNGFFCGFQRAV